MTNFDYLSAFRDFYVKVSSMRKAQKDLQIGYTQPRRQIASTAERVVDARIGELEKILWAQQGEIDFAGKVKHE